jgi:hypothetical protein
MSKLEGKLARLNPNSGHARRIRQQLGIEEFAPAEPVKAPAKKKKTTKKKAK